MVEIEVDGQKVEVPPGSMVMQAAHELGIYVPHFCYHKKLSIAANCRMCLVEVEKAPKPMPACATPVAPGMKVHTRSDKAVKAQKAVMEFLLINHPLDCPICDQGGECQLQDLAVGYGGSASRYTEEKRVVFHKSVGPLISAEEMSRCIQCTRCVRFGQEVAGVMELGMAGRGEHSEIVSFVGRSVDSELSGNMIDVCPVGALTSKPFRYSARTWELSRRRSVAPHDSLGSNLVVQIKQDRVLRVLPLENEAVNECWLSDRDRFSYEGLNSAERLECPMLRQDGVWHEVDWSVALEYARHALESVRSQHGAQSIGLLGSPMATLEELGLLAAMGRELGTPHCDFRLRQAGAALDRARAGVPWLGMPIAEVGRLDRLLLVGSFLRKDHPLLAARVRAAVKRGARVGVVHAADDDLLMPLAARALRAPDAWARTLAGILVAVLRAQGAVQPDAIAGIEPTRVEKALADELLSGERKAILLGTACGQHPQADQLFVLADALARACGATLGWLTEGANGVGGYVAGATPAAGGLDAPGMWSSPRRAYVLMHQEPCLDGADPVSTRAALVAADTVIALSAYRSAELLETADCLLPIAPFTETPGSFINAAGTLQTFNAVVRPRGEARPGWKVLRVLGKLLGLAGFDHDSAESVRAAVLAGSPLASRLSNAVRGDLPLANPGAGAGDSESVIQAQPSLQRLADIPIHSVDPVVRRAPALQATRDARVPQARMNASTLARLGLAGGEPVRIRQRAGSHTALSGEALLEAALDEQLVDGVVRIAAGHERTAGLGPLFGPVTVERA